MARSPSYPKDAPVAPPHGGDPAEPGDTGGGAAAAAKAVDPRRTKHLVTGAAIGIGSAALVAALLYANRSRGDKGGNG